MADDRTKSAAPHHHGHRERPRSRFREAGGGVTRSVR